MKVNIITSMFNTTGYSNHGRQLSKALNKVVDLKITTQLPAGWELMADDEEIKMIQKADEPDRINIIIDLPFNWPLHTNKKQNIGFLVWEGDKIPPSFIENIEDTRISQVWVPSNHVREAILKTVSTDKIRVVPHGVNLSIFKPQEKQDKTLTFLCNKGFRNAYDRGGMQHAIRAFLEEFKPGEARLYLKLNPAYAMPPQHLTNFIEALRQELKIEPKDLPMIVYTYDTLSLPDLANLYNNVDVLLNPTEGEAFSLPCAEAMACGKPVITTDFGGQTDFVNEENGWLIPFTLHEVKHELVYEGVQWATPHMSELRKAMRSAYTDTNTRLEKGVKALQTIKDWTWDHSAQKAHTLLSSKVETNKQTL